MEQKMQIFILTAETLSMSRAAELSFISPQCVSGHIRKLEQEYQTRLFTRRPHLALTAEGQRLLDLLYQIRALENSIPSCVGGPRETVTGKVSLGLPSSRYSFLLPKILPAFKKEFPNVTLKVTSDFSSELALMVERGMLDMAVVVQQPDTIDHLKTVSRADDRFFCLLPRKLLETVYKETAWEQIEKFKNGIPPDELAKFPLIQYPPTSRLRRVIDQYGAQHGIPFCYLFETNHMELFDELSRTMQAASIVSMQALPLTESRNRVSAKADFLFAFPFSLEALGLSCNISLIHHTLAHMPEYKSFLLETIRHLLEEYG